MADVTFNLNANAFPSLTWHRLGINGGQLAGTIENLALVEYPSLPKAVEAKEISVKELDTLFENIESQLGREFDSFISNAIQTLDGKIHAFSVAAESQLESPVKVTCSSKDGKSSICDFVINLEENSSATFIFEYRGKADFGSRIRVLAKEGARLSLVTVNLLDKSVKCFNGIGSEVLDNALVEVTQVELGGSSVFSGFRQNLSGYASKSLGHQVYMACKNQSLDINYISNQLGRQTESSITSDGIVDEGVQKVWRGTIDFKKGCVDSKGDEQENVLLLGDDTEEGEGKLVNKSLPVILCDEEAVEGRHGCSIGRLSPEILFYMQSRGLDENAARKMLVRAKINSVCRFIPDSELVGRIQDFASFNSYTDAE